jgi:N-glycosylase/DNA lyase
MDVDVILALASSVADGDAVEFDGRREGAWFAQKGAHGLGEAASQGDLGGFVEVDGILVGEVEGGDCEEMAEALRCGRGIRILRQDPWETLVTFILSQNNNIPRIRLIVSRLCAACGNRFPEPEDLVRLGKDGLYALGCGFRAKYLADAAEKVLSGDVDFSRIRTAPDYGDAAGELTAIYGVGPKVAACVLLFGFHRTDAFPVDVWMKKALARKFPEGFDPAPLGEWAGYAQQCLFFAERER